MKTEILELKTNLVEKMTIKIIRHNNQHPHISQKVKKPKKKIPLNLQVKKEKVI